MKNPPRSSTVCFLLILASTVGSLHAADGPADLARRQAAERPIYEAVSKQGKSNFLKLPIVGVLRSGEKSAHDAVFSPDSKYMYTCGEPGTAILVWNLENGVKFEKSKQLKGHTKAVRCLAISPDGKLLASAGMDMTIKLWDLETGKPQQSLKFEGNFPRVLAFTTDGKGLVSGVALTNYKATPNVVLWDIADGKIKKVLNKAETSTTAVALSPDGKYIAAAQGQYLTGGSGPNLVQIWNAAGELLHTIECKDRRPETLAFAPDSTRLIIGGGSPETPLLQVVQIPSWKASDFGGKHGAEITKVAFFPDGKHLAVRYLRTGSNCRVLDASTGTEIKIVKTDEYSYGFLPVFSRGGLMQASIPYGNNIYLWSVEAILKE